jgi:UDP-N-acetylglucosamine 2-epimerase (non-hydrolysing)
MDAVVGNSSSGIVEAPSFKLATINIGNRQKGRVRANSTIDVSVNKADLTSALAEVYTPEFMASLKHIVNPYGRGNSSEKVVQTLKTVELSSLKTKQFYDVKY